MEEEIEIATVGLTEEEMIEVVRENEKTKGNLPMKADDRTPDKQDPRPSSPIAPPTTPSPPGPPIKPLDDPLPPGDPNSPGKGPGG